MMFSTVVLNSVNSVRCAMKWSMSLIPSSPMNATNSV
jgi:hypothetical protein